MRIIRVFVLKSVSSSFRARGEDLEAQERTPLTPRLRRNSWNRYEPSPVDLEERFSRLTLGKKMLQQGLASIKKVLSPKESRQDKRLRELEADMEGIMDRLHKLERENNYLQDEVTDLSERFTQLEVTNDILNTELKYASRQKEKHSIYIAKLYKIWQRVPITDLREEIAFDFDVPLSEVLNWLRKDHNMKLAASRFNLSTAEVALCLGNSEGLVDGNEAAHKPSMLEVTEAVLHIEDDELRTQVTRICAMLYGPAVVSKTLKRIVKNDA